MTSSRCREAVFIYGYYGLGNLGDDLLIKTLVEELSSTGFAKKLFVRNMGPIESVSGSPIVELTNLERSLFLGGSARFEKKILILGSYLFRHIKIFKQCHSFVLGGGTLISQNMSKTTLAILFTLVVLARLQGLKVIGLGLGVTMPKSFLRYHLAHFIFRLSTIVIVRDQYSLEVGRSLSASTRYLLASDLVFSMNLDGLSAKKVPAINKKTTVGFTLAEPFLRGGTRGINREQILEAIADASRRLTEKGREVKLIGFQSVRVDNRTFASDARIFEEIILKHGIQGVEVVDVSGSIGDALNLYSSLDIVVGMRYHGLVLSALHLKPFVGFSCDQKVYSLCKSFGMPGIEVKNLTGSSIFNSVEDALSTAVDIETLEAFKSRSALNFSFMPKGS